MNFHYDSFSTLIQHITFPVHYICHILDLVVSPISNSVSKPPICLPPITDHNIIYLEIDIPSIDTVKTKLYIGILNLLITSNFQIILNQIFII